MSTAAQRTAVAAAAGLILPLLLAGPAAGDQADGVLPREPGAADARDLLEQAAEGARAPHVGQVTLVTFSDDGPRMADLAVRVSRDGQLELRRSPRWVLGEPADGRGRAPAPQTPLAPAGQMGPGLDVGLLLDGWDAEVGPPRLLDTGPATPVVLTRRSGAAVSEHLYVDQKRGMPVRRETRDAAGEVLRVVAYTELSAMEAAGAAPSPAQAGARPARAELDRLAAAGWTVPSELPGGFVLQQAAADEACRARWSDGLSDVSIYQQRGALDRSSLDGATAVEMDGARVWTWPGREPLRLVWSGGGRTWTLVTDAPLPVVTDAVAALPRDRHHGGVASRIARGVRRAWSMLTP